MLLNLWRDDTCKRNLKKESCQLYNTLRQISLVVYVMNTIVNMLGFKITLKFELFIYLLSPVFRIDFENPY